MDELTAQEFLVAMRKHAPCGAIIDYEDAIEYAINNVPQHGDLRWFGSIAGGTFYADTDRSLWYPDTSPPEALGSIKVEIGEALTDGLDYI